MPTSTSQSRCLKREGAAIFIQVQSPDQPEPGSACGGGGIQGSAQQIVVLQSSSVTTADVQHALEAEREKMLKLLQNRTGRQCEDSSGSEMSDKPEGLDSGKGVTVEASGTKTL